MASVDLRGIVKRFNGVEGVRSAWTGAAWKRSLPIIRLPSTPEHALRAMASDVRALRPRK